MTLNMQLDPPTHLHTDPQTFQIGPSELIPMSWDFDPNMKPGEIITAAQVVVEKINANGSKTSVPTGVSGVPTISGSVVTQVIRGQPITKGDVFRITVLATISASKVLEAYTTLYART